MKLARKQMITALLSMAAAGALAAPAMAQQGTFGGMPTVTPQSQLEAQKKQAAKKGSLWAVRLTFSQCRCKQMRPILEQFRTWRSIR